MGAEKLLKTMRKISAVVLAAGMSTRMGKPKILLPWGKSTIIEHIVLVLLNAKVDEIIVVAGNLADDVSALFKLTNVRIVKNENFSDGSMMTSLRVGLRNVSKDADGVLVVLGDNPQINTEIVFAITKRFEASPDAIIIPSFQNRRGHPWLLPRVLFLTVLDSAHFDTMRTLLNCHQEKIRYVEVNSQSILLDIDTPEDYLKCESG